MKKFFMLVIAMQLLFGCAASSGKMNNLRLGMTRTEVLQVMGSPSSSSEADSVLYLKYRLRDGLTTDDYYIKIVNGKVDAFGRFGEFGLGY